MRALFQLPMRPSFRLAALAAMVAASALPFTARAAGASADETPYLAENDKAMTKMMDDMTIEPTGDVDRDFVAMMAPHHQGAIDMAKAELRYGHNEQLRRLAQQIVIEQQQEIVAMHVALGQQVPASGSATGRSAPVAAAAPAGSAPAGTHTDMLKEPR